MDNQIQEQLEAELSNIVSFLQAYEQIKNSLGLYEKFYLLSGIIMLCISGLEIVDFDKNNILSNLSNFLEKRNCKDKAYVILEKFTLVFNKKILYDNQILELLYNQIRDKIIPLLNCGICLDYSEFILSSLSRVVTNENTQYNDIVFTPQYITDFMVKLCQINKNSVVLDNTTGSGRFLISAMNEMISNITENKEVEIQNIKNSKVIGIEITENIYLLALINFIINGCNPILLINRDALQCVEDFSLVTAYLNNPPYSAPGKGLVFALEAMNKMKTGYAVILIQENVGSGQGDIYTSEILKKHTLIASIHMPQKLFCGKASVQTATYVFKVNSPHDPEYLVKFIDFSDDGYLRQNKKSAKQNIRDSGSVKDRYLEVIDLVIGNNPKTSYYTKENGLLIEDKISLAGNDWTIMQHKQKSIIPTEEDFKRVISTYFSWKIKNGLNLFYVN